MGSSAPVTRVDPHLYNGVPVEVTDSAWPDGARRSRKVRFVGLCEGDPAKAWVVTFHWAGRWETNLVLLPVWGLVVSGRSDPPPLPEWAQMEDVG